jgi:hypothetical protein
VRHEIWTLLRDEVFAIPEGTPPARPITADNPRIIDSQEIVPHVR